MRQDVVLAFIALASWMTTAERVYHGCKVCTCDWTGGMVDCSLRNLRALPDNGSFPTNATLFAFNNNEIESIDRHYFIGFENLKTIHGQENKLRESFLLPATVEEVDLSQNKLANICEMFDSQFIYSSLSYLSFQYNNIEHLHSGCLSNLSALGKIIFSDNEIKVIEPNSFRNLTSLSLLQLGNNKIRSLSSNMFVNVGKCASGMAQFQLVLTANSLTRLQAQALDLPCLSDLLINENKISEISQEAFQLLPRLSKLDLSGNRLVRLELEMFSHLHRALGKRVLTMLDVSNNSLVSLKGWSSDNEDALVILELNLPNNFLTYIDPTFLSDVRIVTHLDISGNQLTEFPPTLTHQVSLYKLSSLYNNISVIKKSTFAGLVKLIHLNLMENKIHTIEDYAFATLDNIENILMQENSVQNVSRNSFILSSQTKTVNIFLTCTGFQETPTTQSNARLHCVTPENLAVIYVPQASTYFLKTRGFKCRKIPFSSTEYCKCIQCSTAKMLITDFHGDGQCVSCPKGGYYQDKPGQNACIKCDHGTYVGLHQKSANSAADCHVCPSGTDTTKHAGYRACDCVSNHFRLDRYGECVKCNGKGEQCQDDYLSVANKYWWRWEDAETEYRYSLLVENLKNRGDNYNRNTTKFTGILPKIHLCPISESCNGRNSSVRINNSDMCTEGYEGILCGNCSTGYHFWFQKCYACPQKWRTILQIFGFLALLVFLATILYVIDKNVRNKKTNVVVDQLSSSLKILVGFFQVMSAVLDALSYVPWPQAILSVGHFMKTIELNILAVAAISCLNEKLRFNALEIPGLKVAIQLCFLCCFWVYYKIRLRIIRRSASRLSTTTFRLRVSQVRTACLRNSWWILFVGYPSTAASIMATFPYKTWTCMKVCFHESLNQSTQDQYCKWILKDDYSVECNFGASTFLWAVCWILISYVIILPILLFVALKMKNKRTFWEQCSFTCDFYDSLAFLDGNYKPRFWFWEVVEILRKLVLISGIGFFGRMSHSGLALATLLAVLFLVLHAQLQPIERRSEHWLQLIALSVICTNLMMGAVFFLSYQDKRDPGYNSLLDEKRFSNIVITANSFFLICIICKMVYGLFRVGAEFIKSKKTQTVSSDS
ncbi:uncharacterized protein [Oscarella lobularis]|uniref:uncharacterized protein n=1 Tax=Oscarella lobularis TaxID=121494 RepID=UPI0033134F53